METHLKLKEKQLMVTTNWKSTIDTYTQKKKESKHNSNYHITREQKKKK